MDRKNWCFGIYITYEERKYCISWEEIVLCYIIHLSSLKERHLSWTSLWIGKFSTKMHYTIHNNFSIYDDSTFFKNFYRWLEIRQILLDILLISICIFTNAKYLLVFYLSGEHVMSRARNIYAKLINLKNHQIIVNITQYYLIKW